jgi:CelD/BcsL family acetyltransferase involved in cellulose biosynthesis
MRIAGNEREFAELEEQWRRMETETQASIFSGYDYLHTAWSCFAGSEDRLLILVSERDGRIVTIAPFYLSWERYHGIPYRIVCFISEWEGDRPGVLTTLDVEDAWREIIRFFVEEFTDWEVLNLAEQPALGPGGNGWKFLESCACSWEKTPDTVGYHISLRGSWDDYLKGINSKVKENLRNRVRRLSRLPEGYSIERIDDPGKMKKALERFIAVEQSGWKKEAGLGVSKDEKHRAFYERFLLLLSEKRLVFLYFLKSGTEDISGAILFRKQTTLYKRHSAYSPAYEEFSPGIILQTEILKEHFGGRFEEMDLLGMRDNEPGQRHKIDWATGKRETVTITGYRIGIRNLPILFGKKMKRILISANGKRTAVPPAELVLQGKRRIPPGG